MLGVGFEPTPPERIDLKSTALDRSATQASKFLLSVHDSSGIWTHAGDTHLISNQTP